MTHALMRILATKRQKERLSQLTEKMDRDQAGLVFWARVADPWQFAVAWFIITVTAIITVGAGVMAVLSILFA